MFDIKKYQREWARRWRKKHPKRAKANQKRYDLRHPELKAQRNRDNYANRRRKFLAGETRCGICGGKKPLDVDHDHEFARKHCKHNPNTWHCRKCIRGALCRGCNTALGRLEKNWKKAGQYLRKWAKILNRRTTS